MQLLKRSTVQTEVSNQRQKQIDEGIKIATKIDTLRQTLGELEQQHQKFLAGMEIELEERTQPLIRKIASLQKDIEDLEERRKQLMIPLDYKWAEITIRESELSSAESSFTEKSLTFRDKEEKLNELGKELKNRLFKVKTRERELDKTIRTASEELYIAQEKHKKAELVKNSADEYSREKVQICSNREANVAVREREVEMLQNHSNDREKGLNEREILLRDREETLERELKRRKNG